MAVAVLSQRVRKVRWQFHFGRLKPVDEDSPAAVRIFLWRFQVSGLKPAGEDVSVAVLSQRVRIFGWQFEARG
eukprot:9474892-Pyramimonas_sp.AAC.1